MTVGPRVTASVAIELLERDAEMVMLEEALAKARSGQGRLVLVSGEAGIGKSALVRSFCAGISNSSSVLFGACDGLWTPRPLGPFADIAAVVGGRLDRIVTAQEPAQSVYAAMVDELRSHEDAVLVIEDVHWADEATLDVLGLLARRIERLGVFAVATYRSDELPSTHPLRVVLGDVATAAGVRRLVLDPLSPESVAELARPYRVDAEGLYARTAGNPFFVTEVLAAGGALPVTVRDAVLARAARLGPQARSLLDAVATVPLRSELWLLEAVAGDAMGAFDDCLSSGMLQCEDHAVAFRHELARQAVEDSINPHRRVELHRSVLEALYAPPSGRRDLARLAHHAEGAEDTGAVLELAPAAAEHAATVGAHREAAAQYGRALRFAGGLVDEERGELFDRHAYACYLIGEFDAAIDSERQAVECFRRAASRRREGDALRSLSRLLRYVGRTEDAMGVGREAISILEPELPGHELALAYANLSHLHQHLEEGEEAIAWANRAIELSDVEAEVYALTNIANAKTLAGQSGTRELERALGLALEAGLDDHAGRALIGFFWWSPRGRKYAGADSGFDRAVELCTERGLELWRLFSYAFKSRLQLDRGDWDGAADAASVVLRDPRSAPVPRVVALSVAGLVRARRGDPEAWPLLDEAWELAEPTGELQRVEPAAVARAEAAWLEGRADAVGELTEAALALAVRRGAPWIVGELACWRRRAGLHEELLLDVPDPWAAELEGDLPRAAERWVELDAPYEAALVLAATDSEDLLLRAVEELRALGAQPAAAIVARRLRDQGVRGLPRGPRPSTRENPAGLTMRELEVLGLLAEGLRNAEIAGRLFLSERTVDHHVSAVLRKLSVPTRAQARDEAVRLGLLSKLGNAPSQSG
jgi:DNA-binding CsgD family transcriptional regulator/tetratricopeptide (TPR) repeat protein